MYHIRSSSGGGYTSSVALCHKNNISAGDTDWLALSDYKSEEKNERSKKKKRDEASFDRKENEFFSLSLSLFTTRNLQSVHTNQVDIHRQSPNGERHVSLALLQATK